MKVFKYLLIVGTVLASSNLQAQITQQDMYPSSSSGSSDILVRMGQMDETVRSSQGKVEELENKIRNLESQMEMMKKDFELRFSAIERSPAAATANSVSSSNSGGLSVPPSDLNLSGTVDDLYKKGMDSITSSRNKDAVQYFNKILTSYSSHKLAGNAQYWMGEAYYADKDYQRAAVAFAKGYENYKSGPKGADSLLKLGMSMAGLNKTAEACAAFKSLPKEFPKTSDSLKSKATELAKKYSCK
ncbi:MAG: tol-pal system protein YbgF [Alphaproteobacteria bacterium]